MSVVGLHSLASLNFVDALVGLNPWSQRFIKSGVAAASPSPGHADLSFVQARRAAARQRMSCGITVWNGWATNMLSLRETFGPTDHALTIWRLLADTDFKDERFTATFNLANAILPARLDCSRAEFLGDVWLDHARIHGDVCFVGATFAKTCCLEMLTCAGAADFTDIRAHGGAEFRSATFEGSASFDLAHFTRDAWFRGSRFNGKCSFKHARFGGEASLGNAIFGDEADFTQACFSGNASFDGCHFESDAIFDDARYERRAWFSGASFRAASFARARFVGKVDFDGIALVDPMPRQARHLQAMVARAAG